jgi:hypothetical protein
VIPLWLKSFYTLFVGLLVPVYWHRYGAANFFRFSDIALLVTAIALWLESSMPTHFILDQLFLPAKSVSHEQPIQFSPTK